MFSNRVHAGQLLASKVQATLKDIDPDKMLPTLVFALPRGGVPVACEVALVLNVPLSILVSKKIGAPSQPELAIGAVSSSGVVVINNELALETGASKRYIEDEKLRLTTLTIVKERRWLEASGLKQKPDVKGKRVVLVDDGVATGMTTLAAIRTMRSQGAAQIILATPLISAPTKRRLESECDLIVSLISPYGFAAIGQFYEDFRQVEDDEVITSLRAANNRAATLSQSKSA